MRASPDLNTSPLYDWITSLYDVYFSALIGCKQVVDDVRGGDRYGRVQHIVELQSSVSLQRESSTK